MKTIGLIGEKGSGKETFITLLKELLPDKKIKRVSTSAFLGETLSLWNLDKTRSNLQQMAIVMDKSFGKGTLTNALRSQIENADSDIVIYDSIRWESDLRLIRSFPENLVLCITAEPKIRFGRIKKRAQKKGEVNLTFERFQEEEKVATETQIPELASKSDLKIENNGNLSEFKLKIKDFIVSDTFT